MINYGRDLTLIIRRCCVCGKILGAKEDGSNKVQVSDTYCDPCAKKAKETIDADFRRMREQNRIS